MDILPNNQIAFPFPYTDDFPNGIEQWGLGKDLDGKTVMVGRWTPKDGTYLNRQIASFPIVGIGDYPLTGELTLGGNTYTAISIHVNTTEILTGSGWIVLQAK